MSLQGYQDCRTMISQSYSTETKSKRVEAEKDALKQRIEDSAQAAIEKK
jgi:hypothetical protein